MIYYFDRNGHYIGASSEGNPPAEAAGWAEFGPAHAGQVWNGEEWTEPRRLSWLRRLLGWWRT